MRGDAGPATRAIRSGPVYETAVFDVFDGVTYTKGGAVLEMIEAHVGPNAFRRGLAAYFDGQKLSNATAGDLWHYLSQASGTDVAAVARSWTDQKGYPLLQARVTCAKGQQTLELEQQRFSVDGSEDTASLWQVPFAVAAGNVAPKRFLLTERSGKFATGPCTDAPAFIDSSAGFFRVQYPPDHLNRLAQAFPKLPPSARLALLTDTFALGQAGRIPLSEYFALLDRLRPARDTATLVLFLQADYALSNLYGAMYGSPAQKPLETYAQRKLGPMLGLLGWTVAPGDGAVALGLRNELIEALGMFGDAATLRKSAALYRDRAQAAAPRSTRRCDPASWPTSGAARTRACMPNCVQAPDDGDTRRRRLGVRVGAGPRRGPRAREGVPGAHTWVTRCRRRSCRGCPAWSRAISRMARWPTPSCSTTSTRCRARTPSRRDRFCCPARHRDSMKRRAPRP